MLNTADVLFSKIRVCVTGTVEIRIDLKSISNRQFIVDLHVANCTADFHDEDELISRDQEWSSQMLPLA